MNTQRQLKVALDNIVIWLIQLRATNEELYNTINEEHISNYHLSLDSDTEYIISMLDTMISHCELAELFEFCDEFNKLKTLILSREKK